MNNLRATLNLLGLRDQPACELLNISPASLKNMETGRRPTPGGILAELASIHTRLTDTTQSLLEEISQQAEQAGDDPAFTLGITTSDTQARLLGWPSFITHAILGAHVALKSPHPVILVDRIISPLEENPGEQLNLATDSQN